MESKLELLKKYYYLFTGLFVFLIYLVTLAPSIVHIDSGELAAVQLTLGIAHPTGYPLYTMLGYLFSLIPLPVTDIYQLNLLAAIYCAAGVSIFVYTIDFILRNLEKFKKEIKKKETPAKQKRKKKKKDEKEESIINITEIISDKIIIFVSVASGLFLAFSRTYWFQSTSVEVYSLHILLLSLILLTLIKAYVKKDSEPGKIFKREWIIFAIPLALGFTNHLTTLLVLPAVAYLYFEKYGFNKTSLLRIALMLLFFFPVLILVYLYLPIRAASEPVLNWGNPVDYERFMRHVSGKQYQVWFFASIESAKKQFLYFLSQYPVEFGITLVLMVMGVVETYLKRKKFFIFGSILFLFTVLYSINYEIVDIDPYFLLAFFATAMFAAFGLLRISRMIKEENKTLQVLSIVTLLALFVQFYLNYKNVDQSDVYTYQDYTKTILNTVPENSILFSYQWDYFVSGSYYYQFAEDFRPDVAVIDKELLRRSWYYPQLENSYPGIFKNIKDETETFTEVVKPFERDEDYNAAIIEAAYRKVINNVLINNVDERDVFITPEVMQNEIMKREIDLPEGYFLIPHIASYKIVKTMDYVPAPDPDFTIRFPEKRDKYLESIENFIGGVLANRALYELRFNKRDRAKLFVRKIVVDFENYKVPSQLLPLLNTPD